MSWVACAISVPIEGFGRYEPITFPAFGQCLYCKKLPDANQSRSNCNSCGAPLPKTTQTMNYSNNDSRKKKPAKPTGRVYSSVPDLMHGESISQEVQQVYTDISSSDCSSSDSGSCGCDSGGGGGE